MKDEKEQHASNINESISKILGTGTVLKRKKRTEEVKKRELFEKIILSLEKVNVRTEIAVTDLDLNLSTYNESFYFVIDNLLEFHFGKEGAEVIYFYLYERINKDGSIQPLLDEAGNQYILQTPADLWNLIQFISNIKKNNAS